MVRGETPITCAVSSTDSPVKKRSSTSRLFCGSSCPSLVSASSSASRFRSRSGAAATLSSRVIRRASPFFCLPSAGVAHQNAPHHLGGDAKELRPVLPIHFMLIDQSQINLVDQ